MLINEREHNNRQRGEAHKLPTKPSTVEGGAWQMEPRFVSGVHGTRLVPGLAQCQARCFLPASLAGMSKFEGGDHSTVTANRSDTCSGPEGSGHQR